MGANGENPHDDEDLATDPSAQIVTSELPPPPWAEKVVRQVLESEVFDKLDEIGKLVASRNDADAKKADADKRRDDQIDTLLKDVRDVTRTYQKAEKQADLDREEARKQAQWIGALITKMVKLEDRQATEEARGQRLEKSIKDVAQQSDTTNDEIWRAIRENREKITELTSQRRDVADLDEITAVTRLPPIADLVEHALNKRELQKSLTDLDRYREKERHWGRYAVGVLLTLIVGIVLMLLKIHFGGG